MALPDGVWLQAAAYLHHEPQPWKDSPLRWRLLCSLALTLVVFSGVVMFFAYTLGSAIAPYTAESHVQGTVTGLQPFESKTQTLCHISMDYELSGQHQHGATTYGVDCTTAPKTGSQWQIAVDPTKPQVITIVDSRFSQDTRAWMIGFAAIAFTCMAAMYFVPAAIMYRRARRLVVRGPGWRELTATVASSVTGRRTGTTLIFEADDVTGHRRTFTLWQFGSLPWKPTPMPGEQLTFALLSDGSSYALLSTPENPRLRMVRVQVPTDFELRAMGA